MIKKWVLKAIVQKAISYLPYSHRINYFFQKYVTRGVHLSDAYFEDRLEHARRHLAAWERYGGGQPLQTTLELGTGWYPVVPVALFLCGAETIFTVDVSPLTHAQHVQTTLEKFLAYADDGRLQGYLSVCPDRLDRLRRLAADRTAAFETLTSSLGLKLLVCDARSLPLPAASIDLIHSNNTFEHIYPEILRDILREFSRLARPGGVQSHFIDLSDHFAHFDPSITIYNFLRFSPAAWKWIDNSVQPLNRLRLPDYRGLYRDVGLPVTEESLRPGSVDELRRVPVNAFFQGNTEAENAVSHGYFFSKM